MSDHTDHMEYDGHLPALTGQSVREMELAHRDFGFEWPVSGDDTALTEAGRHARESKDLTRTVFPLSVLSVEDL